MNQMYVAHLYYYEQRNIYRIHFYMITIEFGKAEKQTLDANSMFIKMYGKNKSKMVWYKVIKSNQDGSEILTPATPAEIKFWNLK